MDYNKYSQNKILYAVLFAYSILLFGLHIPISLMIIQYPQALYLSSWTPTLISRDNIEVNDYNFEGIPVYKSDNMAFSEMLLYLVLQSRQDRHTYKLDNETMEFNMIKSLATF